MKRKLFCFNCGKEIKPPKKKYCDEQCSNELRKKTKLEYNKYKKCNCEICGVSKSKCQDNYNQSLVVHHKNGDQRDNRINNLITVCRECHWFLHSNQIK